MEAQNPIQNPNPQPISPEPVIQSASEQPSKPKKNFNKRIAIIVAVLFLIVVAGAGAYFLSKNVNNQPKNAIVAATPTPKATDATANWTTYTNSTNGYLIKYPSNMLVRLNCQGEELLLIPRENNETRAIIDMPACGRGGRYDMEIITTNPSFEEPSTNEWVNVKKEEVTVVGKTAREYISTIKPGVIGQVPIYSDDVFIDNAEKKYLIHFSNRIFEEIKTQILPTFKFTDLTPTPTCIPRPACLDAIPRCMIAETSDMCPPTITPTQ